MRFRMSINVRLATVAGFALGRAVKPQLAAVYVFISGCDVTGFRRREWITNMLPVITSMTSLLGSQFIMLLRARWSLAFRPARQPRTAYNLWKCILRQTSRLMMSCFCWVQLVMSFNAGLKLMAFNVWGIGNISQNRYLRYTAHSPHHYRPPISDGWCKRTSHCLCLPVRVIYLCLHCFYMHLAQHYMAVAPLNSRVDCVATVV